MNTGRLLQTRPLVTGEMHKALRTTSLIVLDEEGHTGRLLRARPLQISSGSWYSHSQQFLVSPSVVQVRFYSKGTFEFVAGPNVLRLINRSMMWFDFVTSDLNMRVRILKTGYFCRLDIGGSEISM